MLHGNEWITSEVSQFISNQFPNQNNNIPFISKPIFRFFLFSSMKINMIQIIYDSGKFIKIATIKREGNWDVV